ncbi:MAG: Nucleotidyl transferase [Verrucomicrobia bacterium]|nr:Nucleotidyl transferase [Verrucomicrobiota bacterium]
MSATNLPVAILAGGLATRLLPVSATVPKLLVDIAGEPFFSHQIRLLKKSGFTRFVVCAGHLGEKIIGHYGDGSRFGVRLEYSFDGPALLGTGGALVQALPKLGEAFFFLYGDSYLPIDYSTVGDYFLQSGKLGLMTVCRNDGSRHRSNVSFESGVIAAYDKKTPRPGMRHIDYGFGAFRAEAFAGIKRGTCVDLADVQQSLAAGGQLAGYEVRDRFYEIGSPAGLKELDALLRSGQIPPA